MVRLLRRVVRLGLLAGIGVGVLKVVRGRKAPDPWADSWVSTGPPGGTRPSAAPVAAATPKPPAPDMSAAAPPPAAAAKPPAPAGTATPPPPASPAPPSPGEADKSDAAKTGSSRAAKPTRKGPARKSPTGRAEEPPDERLWVPANDGVCPTTHPVKAKLSSKIFHLPGGRSYKSTKADRCYPDEASAQADGLRPALR